MLFDHQAEPEASQLLIRSTLYVFSQRKKKKKRSQRQIKNHSMAQMNNPQKQFQFKKVHSALNPKLPSKKLFDEPRFFMSIERKKVRILDGLRKISQLEDKHQCQKSLQGRKIKEQCVSPFKKDFLDLTSSQLWLEDDRKGWQPSLKTPFLNYNMHYLIRKRKSMTPSLQKQTNSFYQTLHSSRV